LYLQDFPALWTALTGTSPWAVMLAAGVFLAFYGAVHTMAGHRQEPEHPDKDAPSGDDTENAAEK
jgi:hypothetical protein